MAGDTTSRIVINTMVPTEEPVLFLVTKNLAFGPVEEILRHCGAGKNVQHLRSSE
jgi:hypothetical protein